MTDSTPDTAAIPSWGYDSARTVGATLTESARSGAPRIGSLCSGYGGLDLGLITAVGGSVAWHVEYDKHPSAVLEARFPGVPNYGDVTKTDWTQVEPVDWLTAGYPCQPFSHAGKRKGSADERHLWPAVADAIGVLRPRRVLLENVAGHVSLGLDAVLADLAALGYDTTWGVVRAADAGAPHNRARIFIVAADTRGAGAGRNGAGPSGQEEQDRRGEPGHTDAPGVHHHAPADPCERHGGRENGRSVGRVDGQDAGEAWQRERSRAVAGDRGAAAPADADKSGRQGREPARGRLLAARCAAADPKHAGRDATAPARQVGRDQSIGCGGVLESPRGDSAQPDWGTYAAAIHRWELVTGRTAPQPTEPGRSGERLSPRFVEWMMGLPDGWVTDILPRNPALKALGNGVVPQQAALAVSVLHHNRAEAVA